MKKIICLFQRDFGKNTIVRDEVTPGAEWVLRGEGWATLKIDGTCSMVRDGVLYKRFDAKHGKQPPVNFEAAQEPDAVTGHWPGWVPVDVNNPADKWHCQAIAPNTPDACGLPDGTYELIGPKVQGNPYKIKEHVLIRHGTSPLEPPRTYEGLRQFLSDFEQEGIVFYHSDGRMVKIRRRDFGFKWPV